MEDNISICYATIGDAGRRANHLVSDQVVTKSGVG